MIEEDVEISTLGGMMPTFTVRPEGDGPFAPIIFYMDAPGIREELRNMARRIAREGYFCVLPDLYYRLGTLRLSMKRRNDAVLGVMHAARLSLKNNEVVQDTSGILNFLDANSAVKPGPVGIVGHCMSGSYVVSVAATFPSRIAAASAFYGTYIVTDKEDSPHLIADKISAEVYLSYAETDEYIGEKEPDTIKAVFEKYGVRHDVEVVPGTHHGYCFAERPAYHPEAAEAAWQKLFALFERNL